MDMGGRILIKNTLVLGIIILFIVISFTPLADSLSIEKRTSKDDEIINNLVKRRHYEDYYLESPSVFEFKFVSGELIVKFIEDIDICLSYSPDGILTTGIASVDYLNKKHHVYSGEKIFAFVS